MPEPRPLSGLPGSGPDPGHGPCEPALLDALLDDAGDLSSHHQHRLAWYRELVGPLLVPAEEAEDLIARFGAAEHGLQVLLTGHGDPGTGPAGYVAALQHAHGAFLADGRAEVVGVRFPLPAGPDPAAGAQRTLDSLELSVPAWLELPAGEGWAAALDVLAADGAEQVCLRLDRRDAQPDRLAAVLRRLVDLDLSLRVSGIRLPVVTRAAEHGAARPGLLNVLCGIRAALNGAEAAELAAVLAETSAAPLTSAARRMSEADAAVCRAFLAGAESTDVRVSVGELVALGLTGRSAG